ncbi:hypothetical protein LVJ82_13710 [Vitreoscilla massiliensis]|uniref:Uncharacterized protein n=1 Tax=Vitreoscilla massiliensis TaxID=1689272 RepID=A0ABY4DZ45_9NEIS|nr:hypothetical protein [Vitreoscilla massiliensis]UOO88514.1 hypothetical protein LVJ82_13710 [Vitreoscilla massiliensis]
MHSGLQRLVCKLGVFWAGVCLSAAAYADACELTVLQQLGWQTSAATVSTDDRGSDVNSVAVCQAQSLEAAQAQRLLKLQVGHAHDLQAALYGQSSRCAFQMQVRRAVFEATRKLSANRGFRFTWVQSGWLSFSGGSEAQGWRATKSFGRRYEPLWRNSLAFDAFVHGRLRTECGTGRQIAQLSMLRELFGDEGFDRMFSASELSIGTFVSLHDSDSILLGRHKGEQFADGNGRKTAAMGKQAWLGAPGFIEHVKPKSFVDDISNQAENFIIVDVGDAAQQQLQAAQGFERINADNERIWLWSQQLTMVGERYFERLLYEKDARLWQALPAKQYRIAKHMQDTLAQPQYRQFQVYVHPMGTKPLAYHIARLLDRNPRTPYKIELALHNLPTEIYPRWVQFQLQQCREHTTATPHTAS